MKITEQRLRKLRISRAVTQAEVAKAIGVSASAYSNYENGIREPSNQILVNLCKYYKVTADYLLGIGE